MAHVPPSEDSRPRRQVRQPRWMEDYEGYTHPQAGSYPLRTSAAIEETDWSRSREGFVEMTPLTQHPLQPTHYPAEFIETSSSHIGATAPVYVSTSRSYEGPPVMMNMLQQIQEDNRRLQLMVRDMRRQMDRSSAAPPSLQPAQLDHPQESHPPVIREGTRAPTAPPPMLHPTPGTRHPQPGDQASRPMPPPHLPAQPPPPPRELHHLPAVQDRYLADDDWPPPPPPVAFSDDNYEQPTDIVENLRERLQQLEARLSPAPSMMSEPPYDSVLPSVAPPQPPQRLTSVTLPNSNERTYRGPTPSIPKFTRGDPREFSRLKLALDNILPADATEMFKYQVLCDHLKFEEALLIADSYSNSLFPYSDTMASLTKHYGQPHQLSLRRIAELMEEPTIRAGDTVAFRRFALRVRALVGMLEQLGEDGRIELKCGSHVARLMKKLPQDLRATFRRHLHSWKAGIPSLMDFAEWLDYELEIQEDGDQFDKIEDVQKGRSGVRKECDKDKRATKKTMNVLHGTANNTTPQAGQAEVSDHQETMDKPKAYCPYCSNTQHFLDQCLNFKQLTKEQKMTWVKSNNRCWRCGRHHQAAQCRLRVLCKTCKGKHLEALHEVNLRPGKSEHTAGNGTSAELKSATDVLYLDRRAGCNQVLLKVSKVLLRNGDHTLETYAILDDGSERTILLQEAVQRLQLQGTPESLTLRTVRQDARTLHGSSVMFKISPTGQPTKTFTIERAFTAGGLGLAEHSYPVKGLQRRYKHLKKLPLQPFTNVHPLLLIGSDCPHLVTPIEPVRLGPSGSPAAVKTRLGWTLQGPVKSFQQCNRPQQCLFVTSTSPTAELFNQVEKLWQLDTLPYRNEKLVTRSRRDQEAMNLLEAKTRRVEVDGVLRYATPLLRVSNMPILTAPPEAVLPSLRSTEKRLGRDPVKAQAYQAEIMKLEKSGYASRISQEQVKDSKESWFIPHHLVTHNGKNRIVFNCSYTYRDKNLNELLLPGPNLGASLLGVLLRFREHSIAVSSDIKGMFHQVRLLPEDRPLLRFLWRDLQRDSQPSVYEWQVLPFGTTCSPCCAIYALQRHVHDHTHTGDTVRESIENHFYVDNWLQSFPTPDMAKDVTDKLRGLLMEGGFELRQWASNMPNVIGHLPKEIRSESSEQLLNHTNMDPQEPALGLRWLCHSDTLQYKSRPMERLPPTMRNIYKVLASQYDPIGFLMPYTTRAKVLVQQLWDKKREWDDPLLPGELLTAWQDWENELQYLDNIRLPRCYVSPAMDNAASKREVHIFCDASQRAYGSVGYLRTEDTEGNVEVAFLTARSRVAPKRQLSMPRLELCAALTGAQLADVLTRELTVAISRVVMWTDSTTVLAWIQSDSCRFKVFAGTRIAEIQELTDSQAWRYVETSENPADDLTRGKSLQDLSGENRWIHGPLFLQLPPNKWPVHPAPTSEDITEELRRPTTCLVSTVNGTHHSLPDAQQFSTFSDLVKATAGYLHGAAADAKGTPTAEEFKEAELSILRSAQRDSFSEEVQCLAAGKQVPSSSCLITLAPEYDASFQLIRVGGRLRRCQDLEDDVIHPIVLDPRHAVTKLLIRQVDQDLKHPGAERLFAELRRKFWILRGREAIRREQRSCSECQRWRAQPVNPKMADLPPARLRLHQPAFYSTGIDCFGPMQVKIGRRNEKRWGLLFKCLTTRAVHIEVLSSINTDSFLMALRRFISRRGKPAELLSDQGTNFRGGDRELQEAFQTLHPSLQAQLAEYQIKFCFNPPSAPHFGGSWEREIRSIKAALTATLGSQVVSGEVLTTVLIEIEGILNSKPLGYVSSDVADPDPVTPNLLLMGRPDPSLPQAVYHDSELLSRRQWRACQVLSDRFWVRFLRHYLPTLQTRSKWQSDTSPLQLDTIVMIVDPQLPRASWPIGKIKKVFPGADGLIRTAEVTVRDRTYVRPVSRLIRLPAVPEEN